MNDHLIQVEEMNQLMTKVSESDINRMKDAFTQLSTAEQNTLHQIAVKVVNTFLSETELDQLRQELLGPLYNRCKQDGQLVSDLEIQQQYEHLRANGCLLPCQDYKELADLCLLKSVQIDKTTSCLQSCPKPNTQRWYQTSKKSSILFWIMLIIFSMMFMNSTEFMNTSSSTLPISTNSNLLRSSYTYNDAGVLLGEGQGNQVFSHCTQDEGCKFIKRVTKYGKDIKKETELVNHLAKYGLTIPIISTSYNQNKRAFETIQPRLDIDLTQFVIKYPEQYLQQETQIQTHITNMLQKLHKLGYYHGDVHSSNFMFNFKPNSTELDIETGRFIDFSYGGKRQDISAYEFENKVENDDSRLELWKKLLNMKATK